MSLIYELFLEENQASVNQFYRTQNYNVSCSRRDQIWVAKASTTIAACGFIRAYYEKRTAQNYRLLRSVLVQPKYRSQGVARNLLSAIFIKTHPDTYTLCTSELVPLYQKFGFEAQTKDFDYGTLPKSWQKEIKKGLNLLLRPSDLT